LINLKHVASDPEWGLTLADLNQFIQEADRLGIDPRTPVHVNQGLKGQLKYIDVKAAQEADRKAGFKVANDEIGKKKS
jgi:hypothetical protein